MGGGGGGPPRHLHTRDARKLIPSEGSRCGSGLARFLVLFLISPYPFLPRAFHASEIHIPTEHHLVFELHQFVYNKARVGRRRGLKWNFSSRGLEGLRRPQ